MCIEAIVAYRKANKKTMIEVAKANSNACENLYDSLSEKEGQRKAISIAKQRTGKHKMNTKQKESRKVEAR